MEASKAPATPSFGKFHSFLTELSQSDPLVAHSINALSFDESEEQQISQQPHVQDPQTPNQDTANVLSRLQREWELEMKMLGEEMAKDVNERQQLQSKLKSMEIELERMAKEMEISKSEQSAMQMKLAESESAKAIESNRYKGEVEALMAHVHEGVSNDEIDDMKKQWEKEKRAMQMELQESRDKVESMQKQLAQLHVDTWQEERLQYKAQLDALSLESELKDTLIRELKEELASKQELVDAMLSNVVSANEALEVTQAEVQTMKETLEDEKLTITEEVRSALTEQLVNVVEQNRDEVKRAKMAVRHESRSLRDQLDREKKKLRDRETKLEQTKKLNEELESTVKTIDEKYREARKRIALAEREHKSLMVKYRRLQAESYMTEKENSSRLPGRNITPPIRVKPLLGSGLATK